MAYLRQVATTVIAVGARVIGVGRAVCRKGGGSGWQAVALLAGIGHLTPGGADQLVQAVVDVHILRHHFLVTPEAGLLRIVIDAEHVAHRVIRIAQVLQHFRSGNVPRRTFRFNPRQALRFRLVNIRGYHAVAVFFTQLFPGGRVRQGGHDDLLCTAFHRQPAARQQARHIICHTLQITFCIGDTQDGAGRISMGLGEERLPIQQVIPGRDILTHPVGLRRVWQQLPCDGERHAAQGDAVRLHQAGGIVMADTLANQIEHLLGIRIARVHEAFRNLGGFTGDLLGDAQRAARQGIVFILPGAGDRVFRPRPGDDQKRPPGGITQYQRRTGIGADALQYCPGQAIQVREICQTGRV
nr:hypothetical protein 1071p1_00109 [Serratia proteamaculans]